MNLKVRLFEEAQRIGCHDGSDFVIVVSTMDVDKLRALDFFLENKNNVLNQPGWFVDFWTQPIEIYSTTVSCRPGEIAIEFDGKKGKVLWNDRVDA